MDGDNLQLDKDQLAKMNQIAPLQIKLQTDLNTQDALLLTDTQNELTKRFADRSAITIDLMHIKVDRSNPTLLGADQTQLKTDQTTLKHRHRSGHHSVQRTTRRRCKTRRFFPIALAIASARVSDAPAVDADREKILTDKLANAQTLAADEKQLLIDELQLAQG